MRLATGGTITCGANWQDDGMDPRHAILFEPVRIGPKTLPNRFYQVPHASGFGSHQPRTQAAFRAIKAEGGWGGVCVEYAPVSRDSDEVPAVAADIWDDADAAALALTADAVHAHGALAGLELFHGGGLSVNGASRLARLAPTQRVSEVQFGSLAKEMTAADITRVQRDWAQAARRAAGAGFDIVYVYGAHGYLVTQFLSPATNRRTDGYGGTLAGRARFWLETLAAVRAAVGADCAVATRIAVHGADGLPGIEVDEMLELVAMADHLVDLWDVNVGSWPEDSGTSRYYPEGSQRPWTHRVREATAKPIVAVGRYSSPDLMADAVRSGAVDLIGAARQAIADPFLPRKIADGRLDEIRECTGSNVCILREEAFRHVGCVQNATAGEEYRRGWHPEVFAPAASAGEPVLVVEPGPAGLECAIVLGKRGFTAVHLVEAEAEIGGRLRWTRRLPTLGDWGRIVDWRAIQLDKLPGVTVITGHRITAAEILGYERRPGGDRQRVGVARRRRAAGRPGPDLRRRPRPAVRADARAGRGGEAAARPERDRLRHRRLLRRAGDGRAAGRPGLQRARGDHVPGAVAGLRRDPGGRDAPCQPASPRHPRPARRHDHRHRRRVSARSGRAWRAVVGRLRRDRAGHAAGVG